MGESFLVTICPFFHVPKIEPSQISIPSLLRVILPCHSASKPLKTNMESALMLKLFCRSISPICLTNSGVLCFSSNCTFTLSTVQLPMRESCWRWQAQNNEAKLKRNKAVSFFMANEFVAKIMIVVESLNFES